MPYDNPPTNWGMLNVKYVGGDVYWLLDPALGPNQGIEAILVWHWCVANQRYVGQHVGKHTLVSLEPLHLEPSLLWNCCGKHGFIRDGRWTSV